MKLFINILHMIVIEAAGSKENLSAKVKNTILKLTVEYVSPALKTESALLSAQQLSNKNLELAIGKLIL